MRRVTESAWYKRRLRDHRSPPRVVQEDERTVADELEVRRRVRRYAEQVEAAGRIDFLEVMLEALADGGSDHPPVYQRRMVLAPVRDFRKQQRRDCG